MGSDSRLNKSLPLGARAGIWMVAAEAKVKRPERMRTECMMLRGWMECLVVVLIIEIEEVSGFLVF